MLAAHERDGAERAPVIAPLADLQIPDVRQVARIHPNARVVRERVAKESALRQFGYEPIRFRGAEKEVDLRQCLRELVLMALNQAADGNHGLTCAIDFVPARL